MSFIHDVGIPQMIVSDGERNFTKELLMKHATYTASSRNSQPHTAHGKMLPRQAFMGTKGHSMKT